MIMIGSVYWDALGGACHVRLPAMACITFRIWWRGALKHSCACVLPGVPSFLGGARYDRPFFLSKKIGPNKLIKEVKGVGKTKVLLCAFI